MFELEHALGVTQEASNGIPKESETLSARQKRRLSVLSRVVPVPVWKFALAAACVQTVFSAAAPRGPPEGFEEIVLEARMQCPFLQDHCGPAKLAPNIPPATSEVNAALSSFLAERLQSRRQAGIAAPLLAVPTGLEPLEHFEAGLIAPSPLNAPSQTPHDLEFAVKQISKLGPSIDKWRSDKLNRLSTIRAQIEPLASAL